MIHARSTLCRQALTGFTILITSLMLLGRVSAEGPKKLRLAYAGWEIGTAVAYIGVDGGLFKKHGVEVEELPIRDTFSAGVQSLMGVDMLIGFGSPLAILQPIANGADLAMIGSHVSFDHYGMGVTSAIGDVKELQALSAVFGSRNRIPQFNSTKSLSGHSLGAAGVHEAIYTLLMMQNSFISASANIEELTPEAADMPIVLERRDDVEINCALSNSFGFGGTNASLAFKAPQAG